MRGERQSLFERRSDYEDVAQQALRALTTYDKQEKVANNARSQHRQEKQRLYDVELEQFDRTASVQTSPAPELLTRRGKLTSEIEAIESQRQAQLAALKRDVHKPFIEGQLRMHAITSASIPGLGEYGLGRLRDAGFLTALDILSGRSFALFGLGQRERFGLLTWAEGLREKAERNTPDDLPSQQADPVNTYWNDRRATLDRELTALDGQIADSERSRREAFVAERRRLLERLQADLQQYDEECRGRDLDAQLQRHQLNLALRYAEKRRNSEVMEVAAQRSKIDEREKALESGKKACLVGQELKAVLSFRHFLASLLPKRP
jgi:DNA-binding helix-hairpin-helix protein with protein kinase domain